MKVSKPFSIEKLQINKYGIATYDMSKNPRYRRAILAIEQREDV